MLCGPLRYFSKKRNRFYVYAEKKDRLNFQPVFCLLSYLPFDKSLSKFSPRIIAGTPVLYGIIIGGANACGRIAPDPVFRLRRQHYGFYRERIDLTDSFF